MTRAARAAVLALCLAPVLPGCADERPAPATSAGADAARPAPQRPTRVEVVQSLGPSSTFRPQAIYEREAPGVVTVISVGAGGGPSARDGRGLGTGFVIAGRGEVVTNAHVVTTGQGRDLRRASEVYVEFADANQVPARIVGVDPHADVALLRVDPAGLTLRPLPLGSSARLEVGSPVAAIGSPFGEPQSLSVGVISGLDRSIESLTGFRIPGAIQTDAAINHGNSGGPLVDARGRVIGVNSQISSTGGGGEGVGYAVPVDTVERSLAGLRAKGRVDYAYLGVTTVVLFPQLVRRFDLPVQRGAWVQELVPGGPAARAGLRAGTRRVRFQARPYAVGGDVITAVDGKPVRAPDDVADAIGALAPGSRVTLDVRRGARRVALDVRLGTRPADVG